MQFKKNALSLRNVLNGYVITYINVLLLNMHVTGRKSLEEVQQCNNWEDFSIISTRSFKLPQALLTIKDKSILANYVKFSTPFN